MIDVWTAVLGQLLLALVIVARALRENRRDRAMRDEGQTHPPSHRPPARWVRSTDSSWPGSSSTWPRS